jgi:hypothetical protein
VCLIIPKKYLFHHTLYSVQESASVVMYECYICFFCADLGMWMSEDSVIRDSLFEHNIISVRVFLLDNLLTGTIMAVAFIYSSPWSTMTYLTVRLYKMLIIFCTVKICIFCIFFCMFMIYSTSCFLVTNLRIHGMYVWMYICVCVHGTFPSQVHI